ncbi:MAG TPA: LuxR C-terminal-related transcriptional regulator, partial [Anaerolineae bacterium]|nr:LuxR C-terminal-related transcriptional regulator [Anaerolineae bacterium]
GLGLSVEDVDALEARTEGWIVGLQMAAIALEGQRRRRGSHDLSGFIRAFTGSHRYVLDYLTDEVLLQQPETVRTFLLQTAILERLTGSLCDAVCVGDASTHESQGKGSAALIKSGQEMLEWLDAANLFVVPLDDERRWYRYHHLFGALLRSRLEQAQPDWVPILHLRASKWYEANHLLPEAVHHAFAAGDVERVANMLEGNALSLISYGRLQTSLDWIGALPPEVVRSRPWLCVAYAWALAYTGAFAEALVCLEGLESGGSALDGSGAPTHITGHIYAVRLHVSSLQLSVDQEAESYAQKALELLPEDDARTRSLVAVLLGRVQRSNHEYAAARETLSRTMAELRSAGEGYAVVDLLCQLARVEAQQGNLNKAAATSQKALRMGEEYGGTHGRPLPVVSFAHATLAGCLREWNRLDDAERHAEAAIELGQMWEHADCLVDGHVSMLSIQLSSRDDRGALDTIQKIGQLDRRIRERYSLWLESWEVRVRLALGDVDFAAGWARDRELVFSDGIGWVNAVINLNLARIRIAQFSRGLIQTLDESIARLEAMYERFESVDWRKGAIEALILRAMAWNAVGEVEQGLVALSHALSLAEPEGYVRIFLDEGEPMGELLRQVAARGTLVNYVGRLLSEWEKEEDPKAPGRERPSLPGLVEPLSERELEVLRLLSVGLSNQEIADQLFLAVGTVKKYTSNIYGKLGIHSRTQAVARARELGLV